MQTLISTKYFQTGIMTPKRPSEILNTKKKYTSIKYTEKMFLTILQITDYRQTEISF